MKLPTVAPTVTVPDQYPSPQASPAAFGAGYGTAAAGLQRVSAEAGQYAGELSYAQQRAEQIKYKQGVNVEATTLKTRMDVDTGAGIEDLKLTERDPDGFLTAAQKVLQDSYDKVSQQAKYPETKQALNQHLLHLQATRGVEAKTYSNTLYTQRQAGLRDEGLDSLLILGGNAPDTPRLTGEEGPSQGAVRGAGDYLVAGLDLINQSTPNEKEAADLRIKFKNNFLKARGERAILDNPDADLTPLKSRLPTEMYDGLVTKQEARKKTIEASWDKYYDRLDKDAEAERQVQLTKARAEAEAGDMTPDKLASLRAMRVVIKPEEQAALYAAMTKTKETPSDETTLQRLDLGVHRAVPTATQGQLDAALVNGKLNRKDWKELSDKLTSRRDHLTAENRTIANQEMTQAEQVLRAHSGITGMFDQLEPKDKYLWTSGLRELTLRAEAGGMGGKEKAGDVAMEIGKRIMEIRQPDLNISAETIRKSLIVPAEDAASAKQSLEERFKTGQISKGIYESEKMKILELRRAEQAKEAAGGTSTTDEKGKKPLRPKTGTGG